MFTLPFRQEGIFDFKEGPEIDVGDALKQFLIFDGAMGTMLMKKGLRAGGCPEVMNIEVPERVLEIHRAYIDAKADVISTNSFGGNRIKLAMHHAGEEVRKLNLKAVEIARRAVEGTKVYVAASVGPTGRFVEPAGHMTFAEAYDVFREQIEALAQGGPDFILLETFGDLGEIRAALLAARDVCTVPVICCITYTGRRTLTGVSPAAAAVVLESMGAAAVGANCSGGPEELYDSVLEMQENTDLPIIVQPNAGIPCIREGETAYPLDPKDFLKAMEPYFTAGINIIGSCCGSTPEHTWLLKERVLKSKGVPIRKGKERGGTLAGHSVVLRAEREIPPLIIGERINPTSRKDIIKDLKNEEYQIIRKEAEAQTKAGAHLLDINVGAPGIDQARAMHRVINALQRSIETPIVIDATDPKVIEEGLQVYHGKALVNSVNGEQRNLESILPLIKRYGAAVVGLTLDHEGIPKDAIGRFEIATRIVNECARYGIPKKDIYIDALTLTAGVDGGDAVKTLEALRMIKEKLNVNTVLGISNISYGLPQREIVNASFLTMAIAEGLDAAIIDPLDPTVMEAWRGASLLTGRDKNAENFLVWGKERVICEKAKGRIKGLIDIDGLKETVIKGLEGIEVLVEGLLSRGLRAQGIIDEGLIPALNTVGHLYEKGEYYLPQLMLSAEVAQKAFSALEKRFARTGEILDKGTVIIGTVKGDIHDIGKNMVSVMLKNHGYRVIDLGKNVSRERFAEAALQENAQFAALSALMTTTMIEIPGTIAALKEVLPDIRVIVGGAVLNREFAREVGADGYGKDAVDAVNIIERIRGKQ